MHCMYVGASWSTYSHPRLGLTPLAWRDLEFSTDCLVKFAIRSPREREACCVAVHLTLAGALQQLQLVCKYNDLL